MSTRAESDFQKILSELREGKIADLYLLEGEDFYLKGRLVAALEKLLIEPSMLTLHKFTMDFDRKAGNQALKRLKDELSTPAFMSKRKLIVVKDSGLFEAGASTDDEALIDVLMSSHPGACLVFLEEKTDKRKKKLLTAVRERGVLALINKPSEQELLVWAAHEFKKKGLEISRETAREFIDRYDRNLLLLESEAEKLSLYLQHKGEKRVKSEDLDIVGTPDIKGSIFNLMDMIFSGKTKEALLLLDSLIESKEPVLLILFMFARHIKQLLSIKTFKSPYDAAGKMKIPVFAAQKLGRQASGVNAASLELMYLECHETDLKIKTGFFPERLAVESLIAKFSQVKYNS